MFEFQILINFFWLFSIVCLLILNRKKYSWLYFLIVNIFLYMILQFVFFRLYFKSFLYLLILTFLYNKLWFRLNRQVFFLNFIFLLYQIILLRVIDQIFCIFLFDGKCIVDWTIIQTRFMNLFVVCIAVTFYIFFWFDLFKVTV